MNRFLICAATNMLRQQGGASTTTPATTQSLSLSTSAARRKISGVIMKRMRMASQAMHGSQPHQHLNVTGRVIPTAARMQSSSLLVARSPSTASECCSMKTPSISDVARKRHLRESNVLVNYGMTVSFNRCWRTHDWKRHIVRATASSGESAETRRISNRKSGKIVTDLQQVPGVGPRNEALLMSKGKSFYSM